MSTANLLLSLFPYFLLPTGFSNLFGWMPIARDFPEPAITLSIAAGMLLAVALLVRAVRTSWRLNVISILLLVQVAVAIKFYRDGSDFNLYKLAMWMQPALAAGIAGLILCVKSRRLVIGAVALFALSTAPSAFHYTRTSVGDVSGGMTELRYASILGLGITPPRDANAQITATIENVVAAKFAATELRGRQLAFASRDYFFPNTRIDFRRPPLHATLHPHFAEMAEARPLMTERNATMIATSTLWLTEFSQPVLQHPTDDYLSLAWQLSLFNKFGRDPAEPIRQLFEVQPAAAARNEVVFVHSGRGNHYYLGNRNVISFFQQERDPFAPGRAFNGMGRFMLLRIENPSDEIYLRIAATRTLLRGRTAWKPEGVDDHGRPNIESVHAVGDVPIGAVGNGAFNLFVGPLRPREFEGAHYVAVDFAEPARQILDARTGLKALYNRNVSLDYRQIIGWARDISAVSAADYAHLARPRRIAQFPEDLSEADTLEFSGIYEDGWLSPRSKFVLGAAPAGSCVRLRGYVPELRDSSLGSGKLELTVNGHPIELPAATGEFDWLVPVANAAAATQVDLHFTESAKLPDGDDRPAAAKLQLLEVLGTLPARTFDYSTPGAPRLAASGIDQDGWMTRGATIALPANASPEQLVLRIEFPDWSGKLPAKLRLQLVSDADGIPAAAATEQTLTPGEYATVRVRLPASAVARTLRLDTTAEFPLPAPDTRHRSCRVLQADLAPDA